MITLEQFRLACRFLRSHGIDAGCLIDLDDSEWTRIISLSEEFQTEEEGWKERIEEPIQEERIKAIEEEKLKEAKELLFYSSG